MSLGNQPLVSVLTPVYNGEAYLAACIEGVLSQSYRAFDYTIVNNCSTDGSLEIAQRYAALDPRIRVVSNKEHLDILSNHNHAVTFISPTSKYCKFAFADDLLLPTCLEQMVQVAESDPAIGLVSCYVSNGLAIGARGIPFGKSVVSGREACRSYLLDEVSPFSSFNGLLFRSDEVRRRNPFCRNDGCFEDADVCFEILKERKLGFVHQLLAINRRDNQATLSKIEAFNPLLATDLVFLHRHGRHYLSAQEFVSRWREKRRAYVRFLSRHLLQRPSADFWAFHNNAMLQMGWRPGKGVLAWNAFSILTDYALNPKLAITKLMRMFSRETASCGGLP